MAARAGVEPTTLWLKAIDSTKAPPCPTIHIYIYLYLYKYIYIKLVRKEDRTKFNANPKGYRIIGPILCIYKYVHERVFVCVFVCV